MIVKLFFLYVIYLVKILLKLLELLNLIDVLTDSNDEQLSDSAQILKRGIGDDSVSGDAAAIVLFSMLGRAANILE